MSKILGICHPLHGVLIDRIYLAYTQIKKNIVITSCELMKIIRFKYLGVLLTTFPNPNFIFAAKEKHKKIH